MRASRNLLLLILLPATAVLLFAFFVITASLTNVKRHFDAAVEDQSADLTVIEEMATFSREVSQVQLHIAAALEGARSGQYSELQLYRMHRDIVDTLEALGTLLEPIVTSDLVVAANHNSATGLLEAFESYRRVVIMATDVIAVDPSVAASFIDQAQGHFRQFSTYQHTVSGLLAERSRLRNIEQSATVGEVFTRVLLLSMLSLLLLFGLAFGVARRASTNLLSIADALSELAQPDRQTIPLPRIEHLYQHGRSEIADVAGTLLNFRNAIERQREAEQKAFQLAFYDPLTQLPNRRLLSERIEHALTVGQRLQTCNAVLVLDLDGFKSINDLYGHSTGDRVLVEVAERLVAVVGEQGTVAHLGGDAFGVLLDSLGTDPGAAAIAAEDMAERIGHTLRAPAIHVDNTALPVTASIGISLCEHPVDDHEQPLRYAEAAMYQAKEDGRDTCRFHDAEIQSRLELRGFMERALRSAIDNHELLLMYQVQVDDQDQPRGVEALLRWQHPDRGLVSPMEFIPLAEETGLIVPIGRWVMQQACAQLAAWHGHPLFGGFTIAVNVSARQFADPDFHQQVLDALEKSGADPHRLKLELTESAVLGDVEAAIERMQALRRTGIQFSLDDFGTGYSSLQYLRRLPLDQLKIDQTFVREVDHSCGDRAIVDAIVAMGRALNLEVIAEGVENRQQQAVLAAKGCMAYQGYLFSRPLPLAEMEHWCHQQPTKPISA